MGQDVVGQNFVRQDVTGTISLGQEVSGAGGFGAGSRDPTNSEGRWKAKNLFFDQIKYHFG